MINPITVVNKVDHSSGAVCRDAINGVQEVKERAEHTTLRFPSVKYHVDGYNRAHPHNWFLA